MTDKYSLRGRSKSPVAGRRSSGSPARPVAWPMSGGSKYGMVASGAPVGKQGYEIWGVGGPPKFATWDAEGVKTNNGEVAPSFLPLPPVASRGQQHQHQNHHQPRQHHQLHVDETKKLSSEKHPEDPHQPDMLSVLSQLDALKSSLETRLMLLPSTPPTTPLPTLTPGSPLFSRSPKRRSEEEEEKEVAHETPGQADLSLSERFRVLREQLYS